MPERCVWPVLLGPFACHRAVGADLRAVVGGPGAGGISRCRSGCHLADDFLVGEALDVGEIDRDPELLGQRLRGLLMPESSCRSKARASADVRPLEGMRPPGQARLAVDS